MVNLKITIEMVNGDEYLIKKECMNPNEYIKRMKENLKTNEVIGIDEDYEYSSSNGLTGYNTINATKEEPLLINASNVVTIEFEQEQILTKFERDILKHCLYKNHNYIARDYDDSLFVYQSAPKKHGRYWEKLGNSKELNLCEDMFLCVTWNDEEPQSIVELLKDCEVVENESK